MAEPEHGRATKADHLFSPCKDFNCLQCSATLLRRPAEIN